MENSYSFFNVPSNLKKEKKTIFIKYILGQACFTLEIFDLRLHLLKRLIFHLPYKIPFV